MAAARFTLHIHEVIPGNDDHIDHEVMFIVRGTLTEAAVKDQLKLLLTNFNEGDLVFKTWNPEEGKGGALISPKDLYDMAVMDRADHFHVEVGVRARPQVPAQPAAGARNDGDGQGDGGRLGKAPPRFSTKIQEVCDTFLEVDPARTDGAYDLYSKQPVAALHTVKRKLSEWCRECTKEGDEQLTDAQIALRLQKKVENNRQKHLSRDKKGTPYINKRALDMQARRDELKRLRQDAARALPAPELGQPQLHLVAPLGAQVNDDRADQTLNHVAAAENLQAARIQRAAIAAVDREIPRAALALNRDGDGVPDGVDSDGDVDVPIQPDDDDVVQMQPDDIDYMPGGDDLHPDIDLDDTDEAPQLAAMDVAMHNHTALENVRLAAVREARGRRADAAAEMVPACPIRADGSVVIGDFTFTPLAFPEHVLKDPSGGYNKEILRRQYTEALKAYDPAVVEKLLTLKDISPTAASIGTILNIIPKQVSSCMVSSTSVSSLSVICFQKSLSNFASPTEKQGVALERPSQDLHGRVQEVS